MKPDPVYRLHRVGRVQCAEHEVTGFRCGDGRLESLEVAHLTDQDNIGVLAHHGLECCGEVFGVNGDFALVDDGLFVLMYEFDRVFNGDDMTLSLFIDGIDNGGERGGLSTAGRSGDEDESAY